MRLSTANTQAALVAAIAAVVTVSACEDPDFTNGPVRGQFSEAGSASASFLRFGVRTPDEEMADIASRAPGFAGMYWGSGGRVAIKVTADADPPGVLAVLQDPSVSSRFAGLSSALAESRIEFIADATFDFLTLVNWYDRIRPALAQGGAAHSSIDEARNAIRIGVTEADAANRIREAATQFGIPVEALLLETSSLAVPETTIRDQFRPIPGGVQVDNGNCTMGANVVTDEGQGFILASHCTDSLWRPNNTPFYQANLSDYVGSEASDPSPQALGYSCTGAPAGCRYSDAAFVSYAQSGLPQHGYVARTTGFQSITIDTWHPRFDVTEEDGLPMSGAEVDKLGRTTGWTWGEVTETCIDLYGWDHDSTLLMCQWEADYDSDPGDSGGPVFTWLGDDDVRLQGVHIGRHTYGNGQVRRVFSSWTYIVLEIGYDVGMVTAVR